MPAEAAACPKCLSGDFCRYPSSGPADPYLRCGPAFLQDGSGWQPVELTTPLLQKIDAACRGYRRISGRGVLAMCGTYDVYQPK